MIVLPREPAGSRTHTVLKQPTRTWVCEHERHFNVSRRMSEACGCDSWLMDWNVPLRNILKEKFTLSMRIFMKRSVEKKKTIKVLMGSWSKFISNMWIVCNPPGCCQNLSPDPREDKAVWAPGSFITFWLHEGTASRCKENVPGLLWLKTPASRRHQREQTAIKTRQGLWFIRNKSIH